MKYQYVVWDWNGTLLDDMGFCLDITNRLLMSRGLTPIRDLEDYRERFSFPVKEYYASLGIGPEVFIPAAHQWMDAYMAGEGACPLQPGALTLTDRIRDARMRQIIISASKQEHLVSQLGTRPRIRDNCPAYGIGDIYAKEKVSLALRVLKDLKWDRNETVFIGDTLHDAFVAEAAGCGCVLVANGHQSRKRLLTAGVKVCADLDEVSDLLFA